MYAVTGKMLTVNLKTIELKAEDIPEQLYQEYLGGYGLGVALLMERMDPATDPLGPGNILGFATGYLTGTRAYIASRFMSFGKSPSTLGWGDSNCGGYLGRKMKQAGFDVILFTEISPEPVYLLVEESKAQLLKANDLWGKDCYETEEALKVKHGKDCEIACIGPAGENLSAVAGISTDMGRFAARSALGAVMGSKRVKAVVLKGKMPIRLADPEKMKNLRKKHLPLFKEGFGGILSQYGTMGFYETSIAVGDTPIKNWSSSADEMEGYSGTADQVLQYQFKRYACNDCPIACGGRLTVDKGAFQTRDKVHKVEYETMGMFGSNLLNNNVEALIKINDLCNCYGLDTIGCGALCAYAIECFEEGYIDKKQTEGIELRWGNAEAIVSLVEKIGKAEGIGAVLSKGFEAAIEVFGSETRKFAIAVRNEGLPAHDPRWSAGLALTYFLDSTPARHTQGSTTFPVAGYEMPEIPGHQATGRAKYHDYNVKLTHVLNAAGLCLFGYIILDYKTLPEFLAAADGRQWDLKKLERIGFRISVLRHLFNYKAGISMNQYNFPERALGNPPLTAGETKGVKVDLGTMFKEYLQEMALDPVTALPSRKVFEELNISHFLDYSEKS